jgi:alpha 1,2-mannosyltransferase
VHSIAAGLLLKKEEIHFFNEIAYYHVPFTHCPTGEQTRLDLKCHCNPSDNFDWKGYSCMFRSSFASFFSKTNSVPGTSRYFHINDIPKPEGYEKETK